MLSLGALSLLKGRDCPDAVCGRREDLLDFGAFDLDVVGGIGGKRGTLGVDRTDEVDTEIGEEERELKLFGGVVPLFRRSKNASGLDPLVGGLEDEEITSV